MKIHTTNYVNTLIEIAEDSKAASGIEPKAKATAPSVAELHFSLLQDPYKRTSDEVLFETFAIRNGIPENEREKEQAQFFSKGQACLRCSPLTKTHGWGIHFNELGKAALVSADSDAYRKMRADDSIKKVKAMRSKKA